MDEKNLNEREHQIISTDAEEAAADHTNQDIPVMDKVGEPEKNASAASRGGKGWMIATIVLAAALIIVLIKPPFQKAEGEAAVATINGQDITQNELYDKLVKTGGEATLQSMITEELVDQEAAKAKITVTDADINSEIEDLQKQFGGEEGLNSALSQSGMTMDDLKEQLPLQVKIRKLLEPKVTVTDKDIQTYFDENKATLGSEEQVRASHILVKTKEEADAIEKDLKAGKDFVALAKEKSGDTGSKDKGGDLGFFKRGDMVAEFSNAAFKMKVGDISEPVKSEYG
ncbi:peptidylprolyl isomerase, partial [Paenibacillus forsythiae]